MASAAAAARVGDGLLEYDLGAVSELADWLGVALVFAYIGVVVGGGVLLSREGSPAPLAVFLGCALLLHAARALLHRRGDHLRVAFVRGAGAAAASFEVYYRGRLAASGPFSPDRLRVDTVAQVRGPAGLRPGLQYRLVFLPQTPVPSVPPRYAGGIPLLEADAPERCTDEILALLGVLGIDPAEILVRVPEATTRE